MIIDTTAAMPEPKMKFSTSTLWPEVPYLLAQVAHLGRGSVTLDKDGNVVMHLKIEDMDRSRFFVLGGVDEIWIALKPHTLTDPYHGS